MGPETPSPPPPFVLRIVSVVSGASPGMPRVKGWSPSGAHFGHLEVCHKLNRPTPVVKWEHFQVSEKSDFLKTLNMEQLYKQMLFSGEFRAAPRWRLSLHRLTIVTF